MQFRKLILLFLGSTLLLAAPSGLTQNSAPSEYQLKAAYIYNFAKFIDWPPSAFSDDKAPFVIGMLGGNPFGNNLERTIVGKEVNARPIVLRPFASAKDASKCHLLFISNSMQDRLPEIFTALRGAPVLTVGETEKFIEAGGMVRFVEDSKKIRFQINDEAAKAAHMKISSKLLSLSLPLNR